MNISKEIARKGRKKILSHGVSLNEKPERKDGEED
jgi:hypothetical protein